MDARLKDKPPIFRVAWRLLKEAMRELLSGECDEEEVSDTISRLSPLTKGYKREEDYVTIDEGMKILGMGSNRVKFCQLMKDNGIVNEKFNSVHIGYDKGKILALKHKQEGEYQERLARQDQNKRKKNLDNNK